MTTDGNLILDERQVLQKIKRIAYEIFENNFSTKKIWIAGIKDQGYLFASMIADELKVISSIKVKLIAVEINKQKPVEGKVAFDTDLKDENIKCLVLVDDVLNTGKTMAYCLHSFLNFKIEKIETAVLVNRKHGLFPISASYTGYELSTTINDHVQVVLNEQSKKVYLLD